MAQRTNIIASVVPKEEVGEASAILALVRNIAGAFGVAIFSTILTSATNGQVLAIAQNSVLRSLNPQALQQFIGLIILKAEVNGYAIVYYVSAIVLLVGTFLALLILIPKDVEAGHCGERIIAE